MFTGMPAILDPPVAKVGIGLEAAEIVQWQSLHRPIAHGGQVTSSATNGRRAVKKQL